MSIAQIVLRHGTSDEWTAANPVLAQAELGVDTTLSRFKLGDGATRWNLLPWQSTSLDTLNDTLALIDTRLTDAQAAATTATEQAAVATLASDTQTLTRQALDAIISAAGSGGTGTVTLVEDPNDPGTYLVGTGPTSPTNPTGTTKTLVLDTDGAPYFDATGAAGTSTIALDTDGVYYIDTTAAAAGVTLLDTDGIPYVSGV
jgi:hypothetical protein